MNKKEFFSLDNFIPFVLGFIWKVALVSFLIFLGIYIGASLLQMQKQLFSSQENVFLFALITTVTAFYPAFRWEKYENKRIKSK